MKKDTTTTEGLTVTVPSTNITKELSEDGRYEVCHLKYKVGGQTYEGWVRADFALYSKAYGIFAKTGFETDMSGGTGARPEMIPTVDMDTHSAGDCLLFEGWVGYHNSVVLSDDRIRSNMRLRIAAVNKLSNWLSKLTLGGDVEDMTEDDEKKS